MNFRKMAAISSLALLTAVPFAATAGSKEKATDACIQAFVDSHLPKGRTVRVHKKVHVSSPVYAHVRQYTVTLSARLARSGTELATARCVVSHDGEVIALDSSPLANNVSQPVSLASVK